MEYELQFTDDKLMDKNMCPKVFIPKFGINYPMLLKYNNIEKINFAFFKFCNTLFEIAGIESVINSGIPREMGIMGEAYTYASNRKGTNCTIMEFEDELRNVVQQYLDSGNVFENEMWKEYIFTQRNYIG